MKMTTFPTGAFAVLTRAVDAAAGHRERRATGLGSASAFGSALVPTAARIASASSIGDVPTPVPVRLGGAYG